MRLCRRAHAAIQLRRDDGRFLSVDLVVQDGGSQALNPYSYIQNNPLSGTDPSGHAAAKDECAASPI
jgi:hypothetical protein